MTRSSLRLQLRELGRWLRVHAVELALALLFLCLLAFPAFLGAWLALYLAQ